jgi:hypothetical protein
MRHAAALAGTLLAAALPAQAAADEVPDGASPHIGFAEQVAGGDAANGLLSGAIDDFDGVQSLWVAMRASARSHDGFCRWWSVRLGRLTWKSTSCQSPEWMPARLARTDTGFSWRIRLRGHPSSGHYIVIFRAVDGGGNVQRARSAQRGAVRLRTKVVRLTSTAVSAATRAEATRYAMPSRLCWSTSLMLMCGCARAPSANAVATPR